MQLYFRNSYGPTIWVAVMSYDPAGCSDGLQWRSRGWWTINYGGSAYVLKTSNRYAYYYAEAANGAVWTGPFGPMYVTQNAFDGCAGRSDARAVGPREVYISADTYTVNLTP